MNKVTIFSPNNIEVLLHCHTSPRPHPRINDAQAVMDAVDMFLKLGAIEIDRDAEDSNVYKTTPMGKAWVNALCNTPPPTLAYVDENGKIL